jgi:hypothetical protein
MAQSRHELCRKCGGPTYYHVPNMDEDDDCSVLHDKHILCYTTHDDNEDVIICLRCKSIHIVCPSCHQLCRFLGHQGLFGRVPQEHFKYRAPSPPQETPYPSALEDALKHVRDTTGDVEILTQEKAEQYHQDHANIAYYVGDRKLCYAETVGVLLTGPDGGYAHAWRCDPCQKTYRLTDK